MMTPAWILDIFAAVMLVVAAVSTARLAVARPWRQMAVLADVDIAHLLMAIAMAGMLAASLRTLPNAAWDVIFGVLTAWFAYRVVRDAQVSGVRALKAGHCAPHLIHAAAMLYMFLALSVPAAGGSGMAGMGGSAMQTLSLPFLTFLFAGLLIGYAIWDLDQVSGPGTVGHYSLVSARLPAAAMVLSGTPALAGAESRAAMAAPIAHEGRPATSMDARPSAPGAAASQDAAPSNRNLVLAPWVTTGCRIAMGVTMAFMLLIMI